MMVCSQEACAGKVYGHGWCAKHYRRWQRYGSPDTVLQPKDPEARQAWIAERLTEPDGSGCRDWPWGVNRNGYGSLRIQNKHYLVPRLVLSLTTDQNDPALVTRHSCHRSVCAARWHLSWGTQKDNITDMIEAGRARWQVKA